MQGEINTWRLIRHSNFRSRWENLCVPCNPRIPSPPHQTHCCLQHSASTTGDEELRTRGTLLGKGEESSGETEDKVSPDCEKGCLERDLPHALVTLILSLHSGGWFPMECVQNTDVKRKIYNRMWDEKARWTLRLPIKIQNDVNFFSEDDCAGQILNLFY